MIGPSRKKWLTFLAAGALALGVFSTELPVPAQETKIQQPVGTIQGVVHTPWLRLSPALVYIDHVKGDFPPPKKDPFMSQKDMVFRPHILPVLKGTAVDFTNDDTVSHNVFSPPGAATRFNLGIYGQGVKKTVTFNNLGEVPLLCSLHPEMIAYVIVLQNPYFAFTDNSGRFEIKNVPAGSYRLQIWQEKLQSSSKKVVVEAGKTVTVNFEKEGLKER
ncbi:MAG: carboxypeptidase regulatory-like domain-containing protein [Planctomycetaceae bacterium]